MVPRSIVKVAVTRSILFKRKNPSLDESLTSPSSMNFFEFNA